MKIGDRRAEQLVRCVDKVIRWHLKESWDTAGDDRTVPRDGSRVWKNKHQDSSARISSLLSIGFIVGSPRQDATGGQRADAPKEQGDSQPRSFPGHACIGGCLYRADFASFHELAAVLLLC